MADPEILSVSALSLRLKALVENGFPHVCVEGEISNLSRATSGHVYLTLKDETAQIRAVLWRSAAARIRFELHDGLHVVAAGPIEVYAARGSYQIVIERLAPQGIGPLELAFRQRYEKLAAEGLFRPERKRPLPPFPRRLALVTSPTGAAVRDMLQVITRRWPACDIVILPVAVQGQTAAGEISAALRSISRLPGVDVVITGRGGGSLEDLWAFNEEVVARAILDCPVPVVSAVGHEVDVTIADLVADKRALTPSEAGEIVVPDRVEILSELEHLGSRISIAMQNSLRRRGLLVDALAGSRALARPLELVHDRERTLDELSDRLRRAIQRQVERARHRVEAIGGTIDALSPLKVLSRGYSLTRCEATGEITRRASDVRIGERIETRLARGRLTSVVDSVEN
ncbi:MAG TPA: exodeoxyribonuclease VII large subunit [Planctomycetaceae bacterium]|jgi:exodeoxyribonuclease VII large subunit|nr:exodeoxyribonuclease VII large subunit [Planctomycetaceae bacterium]